jgi:hypothetical protein
MSTHQDLLVAPTFDFAAELRQKTFFAAFMAKTQGCWRSFYYTDAMVRVLAYDLLNE